MHQRTVIVTMVFLLDTISDIQVLGQTLDGCAMCHPNATCDDKSDGSGKVCNCMYGFVGNGRTICQDKDECQIGAIKICGPHTSCHNTYGSYYCTCLAGYSPSNNQASFIPNDGTHCQDIDECRIQGICGEGGRCSNSEGAFDCYCQMGYQVQRGVEPFHPPHDKALCNVLDCGQPPSVEDAYLLSATGTRYGSVASYDCEDGFLWRSGDNSSVCGPEGIWNGQSLVCEAKCGPTPALANSEVVWHNNSVVLYRCLDGYHSWRGMDISVCDITGIWQVATLTCTEIKPAITELVVFKETCLRWKAEKYKEDSENYSVVFVGLRDFQRTFCDKRQKYLSSKADQLELCLNLLPVTNYTITVTAVSAKFSTCVTTNTSLKVLQVPAISYREVETSVPTLTLHRLNNTLDPISFYQVFVLPVEGTLVFDCASHKNPDFASQTKSHGHYIAAQMPLENVGRWMNFTVGDGRFYGEFYNAPLRKGRDYYIILRVVGHWKKTFRHSCVLWAKVIGISYIMRVSSISAAGSIALFFLAILGGYTYTWFLKKR